MPEAYWAEFGSSKNRAPNISPKNYWLNDLDNLKFLSVSMLPML